MKMNTELRTVTIARDIAEEEAATAYEALSEEVQDLREEVAELRRRMAEEGLRHANHYRRILVELNRLRNALG